MTSSALESRICTHIAAYTPEEFLSELLKPRVGDLVELRVDYVAPLEPQWLAVLRAATHDHRCIFTCRAEDNGGRFRGAEHDRLAVLDLARQLGFGMIDVELDAARRFPGLAADIRRDCQLVLSHHDFTCTPSMIDLRAVRSEMRTFEPHYLKIATMVRGADDAARLLALLTDTEGSGEQIVVGMGMLGRTVRLLGPPLGSAIAYAIGERSVVDVPGGISATAMQMFFRAYEAGLGDIAG